jgi:hypothetical protein
MKRGQVTLFVIVALVLIAAVVIFFLLRAESGPSIDIKAEEDPNKFFASCVEEDLRNKVEIISSKGGYLENPLSLEFQFADEKEASNLSYLCYTSNYYLSCVNQEPLLIQHLKEEIKKGISESVDSCFDDLTKALDKKGYVVDASFRGFEILLNKGKIIIETNSKITLTRSGETSSLGNLKVSYSSKFYDLAILAQEITSQEARFCNFEHLGYMLLYPEFDIDKFRTGNSDTIYTLGHRGSGEEFRFAVRSCVIPPGF